MSEMRIGITGSNGFVGSHLLHLLNRAEGVIAVACPRATFNDDAQMRDFVQSCDVVVHLAGVNRGTDEEVTDGNVGMARRLTHYMRETGATPKLVFSSSIQRDRNNVYGRAKLAAETVLADWARAASADYTTLVMPNVFGPGCRPFYNSVVATFCHLLTLGECPEIHHDQEVEFIDVNVLVKQILSECRESAAGIREKRIAGPARLTVRELLSRLDSYRQHFFDKNIVPDLSDPLDASLYATFLSYVSLEDHCHQPPVYADERGHLFEVIKMANGGQIFFSTTKPGVIRGDHYHTRKIEWFCVVRGEAAIRIRRMGSDDIREFEVSGEDPRFISIPVFHTHHIENVGDDDLLTMFWCNEIFDATDPDTFAAKVA